MKKPYLIFLFIIICSLANGQSFNLGLRFESFAYSINYTQKNANSMKFMPIPLGGYLKAGIIFTNKYELELKTGVQIIDPFAGPEYQILFKYGISKTLFPLFTYMLHSNAGDSHTSGGTYDYKMDFIGFGVEAKLREFLSLDLVFYVPVGNKDLEYEMDYLTNSGTAIYLVSTSSKMGPMVKLGFIFNIVHF